MTPGPEATVIAIAGMAALTYAVRAGGLVVARVLPPTPFVTAFLRHLGTSVIVALVTATLARSDAPGIAATAVTIALTVLGRPTAAILTGMAVAALLRQS
ncbi:MAG: AzlD domain-containing protein [Vicinamibacterales bacterium]